MCRRTYDGDPIDATMRSIDDAPYWSTDGETVDVVDGDGDGRETTENLDTEAAIQALRERDADAEDVPGFILAVERAIGQFAAEATVDDAGALGYLIYQYRQLVTEAGTIPTPGEQRTLADYADDGSRSAE